MALRTLALVSLLAAAAPAQSIVEPQWDYDFRGAVSETRPLDGARVVFDGTRNRKIRIETYSENDYGTRGRWIVDLERGTAVMIEPAKAESCPRIRVVDNKLEVLDEAGRVRFTPSPKTAAWKGDRSCKRVVAVEGDYVVAFEFEGNRKRTLGKWKYPFETDARMIFFQSLEKGGYPATYDLEFGVVCDGYFGAVCTAPPQAVEPGLDRNYRPAPNYRRVDLSDGRFELYGSDGRMIHRGRLRNSSEWSDTPDGRWFAYGDNSLDIVLVDLQTGKSKTVGACDRTYCRVKFSGGGKWLAAGKKSYSMPELTPVPQSLFDGGQTTPDDRYMLVDAGGGAAIKDLTAGTTVADLGVRSSYEQLFSPSSKLVALKSYERSKYLSAVYEIPSGRRVAGLPEFSTYLALFSPDERYFLTSGTDSRSWYLTDLRYDAIIVLHFPDYFFDPVFTADGRWLAGYGGRAWRLRRGKLQRAAIAALSGRKKEIEERLANRRRTELQSSAEIYAGKAKARRTPKGEFESAAEYAQRMKAADEQDALERGEAAAEAARIGAVYDAKDRDEAGKVREALQAALDEEINEPVAITVGSYDADAEEFDAVVDIDGSTRAVKLAIARKDAQAAKSRRMSAEASYRHRLEDGKPVREDLRLSVSDKELGQLFTWSSGAGTVKRSRTAPAAPAKLDVKAEFADADGDARLGAGETAKISVVISNSGAGASYGASVAVAPAAADGLSYAARHFAGEIAPGASKTVTIPVKALAGAADGSRSLTVSAEDANGFASGGIKMVFETRARRGAKLSVASIKVSDSGGDGVVSPGELAEIAVVVRNDGEGAAGAAAITLAGANADAFVQGEARRTLGALAAGASATARFTVFSNTSAAGTLRLRAALGDGVDSWDAPVEVPLSRPLGSARELVVKGKDLPKAGSSEAIETPAARGAARPEAYAVILGVEDYPKAPRVSHARRDAAAFRAFAAGVLGVPDDANHMFYLDEGVTLAELRKAFSPSGWLARRVGPQSEVFVFYAGHGAPSLDGKGAYLVPQDGDPNYAVETGFPIDDMLKSLDGSKAKSVTVWLDACFSGADRESRPLIADARPLSLKVEPVVPPGKVSLFSAASGSQVSSAFPAKRHGLFTWYALRGLDGEADADKDGTLTAGELADFLGARVSREAGAHDREQTPGFRGDRARPLARYEKRR